MQRKKLLDDIQRSGMMAYIWSMVDFNFAKMSALVENFEDRSRFNLHNYSSG